MKLIYGFLIGVIVVAVAFLAFNIGKGRGSTKETSFAISPTPKTVSLTPTPADVTKKVTGGGILSFPKYEITVPAGWIEKKESENKDSEKVIVTKNDYQISITQGGFGGAACLYPGEADIEGPSARYDNFKEITTLSDDSLRRSWTGQEMASKGFGICHKSQYGWQAPTLYGHIAFITPISKTKFMLDEMDNILASLKII